MVPAQCPVSHSAIGRMRSRRNPTGATWRVASSAGMALPVRMNCPGARRSSTARRMWFHTSGTSCHSSMRRGVAPSRMLDGSAWNVSALGIDIQQDLTGCDLASGLGLAAAARTVEEHRTELPRIPGARCRRLEVVVHTVQCNRSIAMSLSRSSASIRTGCLQCTWPAEATTGLPPQTHRRRGRLQSRGAVQGPEPPCRSNRSRSLTRRRALPKLLDTPRPGRGSCQDALRPDGFGSTQTAESPMGVG